MLEFISVHWIKFYAAASMVFYLFVWAMKKTYAPKERVDNLERRINSIESEVKQLPSKDDVHKLELTVNTVNGKIDAVSQQLIKLQRTTEMLLENELQGDKK